MQIIKSKHCGFCSGVKRAMQIACENAEQYGFVYSLGSLIHNPQEMNRLKNKIIVLEDLTAVNSGNIIIRAHGVPPAVFAYGKEHGLNLIDATCPLVKKVQEQAKELYENGCQVIIIGDCNHPEVQGILGYTDNTGIAIDQPEQVLALPVFDKIGVVAQTTQTQENFASLVQILQTKTDHLIIHNTICNATLLAQNSARELAVNVDMIIVIGGRNSSNTKMLFNICSSTGVPTYQIESSQELVGLDFSQVNKLGITAGSSTPDWIIEEVVVKMSELEKEVLVDGAENQGEGELSFAEQFHLGMTDVHRGSRVKGVVVQVKNDELLVDIGGKSEGVLPASELIRQEAENITDVFHVGDEIEVLVLKKENKEGYPVLSKKRIDQELIWDKLYAEKENNTIINVKILEVVKGGLLADAGVRGFIPASLVSLSFVEDFQSFVGKEVQAVIIECNKATNKLVLSPKAVLLEESKKKKAEVWGSIAEGQTREGVVRRLTNFGAFVDLGGVDGLLHVSEMAWHRINKPSDLLKEGEKIEVYVLNVDAENQKISLGLKQLVPNPWTIVAEKYPEGSIVSVKVVRTAPFGAFVELEPGVEGLVHISQLAYERVNKTEDIVKPGDVVEAKVLSIDLEAKRIGLSIKEATTPPVTEEVAETPAVQEETEVKDAE